MENLIRNMTLHGMNMSVNEAPVSLEFSDAGTTFKIKGTFTGTVESSLDPKVFDDAQNFLNNPDMMQKLDMITALVPEGMPVDLTKISDNMTKELDEDTPNNFLTNRFEKKV